MGSDISRLRFDPFRDFAGMVLQQGRLLLDADFNEYVALLDRRLRAETCDLTSFGPDPNHAGVAWVPRQAPDAFKVLAAGGGLTIGRGRMYVDGLLAENHGLAPPAFDPLLAESTGTADLAYGQQPYWPTPDALPGGGPHLAYLDVWQREVTYLEAPDLVEIAVGVDTTARMQTAWQVRLLANIGNATCASHDDAIPGWLDVIAPSAGRLTTDTIDIAPTEDPCKLPPTGGYRGLENQTYRIEVHEGGPPGTATFKWSRVNASVAIPVVEMVSSTTLRLATVGKDDVLRISTGDWVEIVDDHYELGQRSGVMRKVTVDDAERTISFTGALPADLQPASAVDAAARHLRARRWDQSGIVKDGTGAQLVDLDAGTAGTITVPASAATQVVLEAGIVASFSLAAGGSGRLHPGDYWIFVARTADTSIEKLAAAPPLGIHHHYARLGTVTFPGTQTDCRRLWPPLGGESCGCTVCVTPESHAMGTMTIQAAVALVKAAGGGTVCLEAGIYVLAEPVNADGARSLRIHGAGIATVLVARGTALTATGTSGLTVEDLAIVSGAAAPAAIQLRRTLFGTLHDLAVLSFAGVDSAGSGIELSGIALATSLRRNVIVAPTAIDTGEREGKIALLAAVLAIEDNLLIGRLRGADLGTRAAYLESCRIARNDVFAGQGGGIFAIGLASPGGALTVAANTVSTTGAAITVGADALVEANAVNGLAGGLAAGPAGGATPGTDGIVVAAGGFTAGPGHVRIAGNRVHDRAGVGISLRTAVQTFMVKENVVTRVGAGILVERGGRAARVAVDDNEVFDVAGMGEGAPAAGIGLMRAASIRASGNTVLRVAQGLKNATLRAGVYALASTDVRITANVVEGIGPPGGYVGLSAGIAVFGPFTTASVSENSARFSADVAAPPQGTWVALMIEQLASAGITGFVKGTLAVPIAAGGIIVFTEAEPFLAAAAPEHAGIAANSLTGGGVGPTCLASVRGDLVAEGNQCEHAGTAHTPMAMRLAAQSITATSNRARGTRARIVLDVDPKFFAAVGNLAPGGTHLAAGPLPAPWAPLNPQVP